MENGDRVILLMQGDSDSRAVPLGSLGTVIQALPDMECVRVKWDLPNLRVYYPWYDEITDRVIENTWIVAKRDVSVLLPGMSPEEAQARAKDLKIISKIKDLDKKRKQKKLVTRKIQPLPFPKDIKCPVA